MKPTTDGISFNSETVLLTNTVYLGTFTNTGVPVTLHFPLALPAVFATEARVGFGSDVVFSRRRIPSPDSLSTLLVSGLLPPAPIWKFQLCRSRSLPA